MIREELLWACHYYKGEDTNPFQTADAPQDRLWEIERDWCALAEKAIDTTKEQDLLSYYIREYEAAGLAEFQVYDQVPLSLKSLLFHEYCEATNGNAARFKVFYEQYYY